MINWTVVTSRTLVTLAVIIAILIPLTLTGGSNGVDAAPTAASGITYTTDADFDLGTSLSVNHDAPNNDQLQLSQPAEPFPFVNIAASSRGTVVRIDVDTGDVLGEYRTAPAGRGLDPSRTTVDQLGNVWVANRAEGEGGNGSVVRVGLIIGGTRTDASGNPDPAGNFLQPPFGYNTCEDRHGATSGDPPDDLIKTSLGLGDFLSWDNPGGVDDNGGVSSAEDECIINYTRVTGTGTRTLAIDANNDVWVGGFSDKDHEKLDGVTGQPVPGTQFNIGCGGYGGLIDGNGVLWGARSPIIRFEPELSPPPAGVGECLGNVPGAYGFGIDPNTGNIWVSELGSGDELHELDPADGSILNTYPQGFSAQGVAVDGNSHVWVAELFGSRVAHFAPDPAASSTHVFVGYVSGFEGTTGVAVDANGKIWASENNSSETRGAARIDPNAGLIGGGGYNVGEIDMTVGLDAPGLVPAKPYNYSDMTGFVAIGATSPQGSWTVTHDSGNLGNEWDTITWNTEPEGSEPEGTSIMVLARASDTEAGLAGKEFIPVSSGVAFSLTGQFIEVQATLKANSEGESPILSDITIGEVSEPPTGPKCAGLLATIIGSGGDDVLFGTPGPDVIVGLGGDDVIRGFGGDDVICAGMGDDIVIAGDGNDSVYGGLGDDLLIGGQGDDFLSGGFHDDILIGGPGDDFLSGGFHDDILIGGPGDDQLIGGPGNDFIFQ